MLCAFCPWFFLALLLVTILLHTCCNVFLFHVAIAILFFFSVVALMVFLHVAEFLYLSYDNCLKYLTYIIL
jgi:hypothetical protein